MRVAVEGAPGETYMTLAPSPVRGVGGPAINSAPAAMAVPPLPLAAKPGSQPAPPASTGLVQIFDATSGDDVAVSSNPREIDDPVARQALQNAQTVTEQLLERFQRQGWDGKGTPMRVVVHYQDTPGQPMNNAFWDRTRGGIYLGDGDGRTFAPLGSSLDVVAHEITHAVVDSEVNLRYEGQQGGVNESFADVLASVIDKDDWLIGEDVFTPGTPGDGLRDLERPKFSHMKQLTEPSSSYDVHDLSGIPSLAAVKVAGQVGREKMGKIWYQALTEHLGPQSGYAGAARATLQSAAELFGPSSREFQAVNDAWQAVGVRSRYTG